MQDTPKRNEPDICAAEGGPYAGMIREFVASGPYGSAAEVVLEGLALVREREQARKTKDDWLKAEIQMGVESADRGDLIPAEEVIDRLRARYQARVEK